MDQLVLIATVFKTPCKKQFINNSQKGVTIIELVAVITLLLILTTLVVIFVDPVGHMKKSRDEKRLSDLSVIDRVISEFVLDNKRYPDQEILRKSNTLPAGSTDVAHANLGWIYDDLSAYNSMLPTDPLNDGDYYYSYFHNSTGYEINARLEILTDEMLNDGGNDLNLYEVGNNLNLISP